MSRKISVIVTAILTYIAINTLTIAASNIQDAHDQLLKTGNATVYIDENTEATDFIADVVTIDEDTPYDADMIEVRGTGLHYKVYTDGKLEITTDNVLNIEETEKLLDTMTEEIDSTLSENATQKEILNAITKYIGKTYKYDNVAYADRDTEKNFVTAYHSDRKIICGQYAALTYLLCDRYGIDCKIVAGNQHAYNAIRLDGEDTYTAYDLTKTTYKLSPKVTYVDLITGHYTLGLDSNKLNTAIGNKLNGRITVTYTFPTLTVIAFAIVIAIIVVNKNMKSGKKSKSAKVRK